MDGRSSVELSVEGGEDRGGQGGENGARLIAVVGRELEEGGRLRDHVEVSKVPEYTGITILELDIVTSLVVGPVRKSVNARPMVAAVG